MHTTGSQPAYLVYFEKPGQELQQRRFVDANLLTARRAAMTYAESLHGTIGYWDITTQLAVYLIEQTGPDQPYSIIARALLRKKHKGPQIAGIDTIPFDRIADEQQTTIDNLTELYQEARYYKANGHGLGIGTFTLSIQTRQAGDIASASGELLADALSYAQATTGGYNTFVSDGRGYDLYLSVSTCYNLNGLESFPTQLAEVPVTA